MEEEVNATALELAKAFWGAAAVTARLWNGAPATPTTLSDRRPSISLSRSAARSAARARAARQAREADVQRKIEEMQRRESLSEE